MSLDQFEGHTPGPWQCILNNPIAHGDVATSEGDVVTSEGDVVARIRGWGLLQKLPDGAAQQDANGRLVAAAPDLLAEVRRLTAELAQAREVLRGVECSYSGMLYGDDKAGGPSEYARGWGDCLTTIKSALAAKGGGRDE